MSVPTLRVRILNDAPIRETGDCVLYWMVAHRRLRWSYPLDRAIDWSIELGRPLVIFEPLRAAYPYASERLHRFVIDGMVEHRAACAKAGVTYLPYVEPEPGAGRGLLEALAARAAVVVTDDYPTFFVPPMIASAGERLDVRLEAVDGNGLIPIRRPEREHPTARGFRRWSQGILREELSRPPTEEPLARDRPRGAPWLAGEVEARWPWATEALADPEALVRRLPIDREVSAVEERGGRAAGLARWKRFADSSLERYADDGNHPDEDAVSGLSPWLHFGHLGAHEIFSDLAAREGWSIGDLAEKPNGKREGWWNMSAGAEAYLEQLACWRELAHATCARRPDHAAFSSLPSWAHRTLAAHSRDRRPTVYSLEELEGARTHDEVWNAAQRQLRGEGRIHNYLRMLWGKKILEWSPSPEEALTRMLHLNDRWALDGRDPNSYAGITWVLGRCDRAWGPERPIFGTIRFMSSDSAKRKLRMRRYLARWGDEGAQASLL